MIEQTVEKMNSLVLNMQASIEQDIADIKEAKHEKLLERNDEKQAMMDEIVTLKQQLNELLIQEIQNGVDVNVYREQVDALENELKSLYVLNSKLASIVLPLKKMYKDIVDELTAQNGGNIIEVKA